MYDVDLADISGFDLEEALPSDLAMAFLARGRRFHARKGLIVIAQGADASDVYLIISGLVRFSVISSNGRETILREIGPGRLFGEMAVLGAKRRSASAVVVADAVIGIVSGSAFTSFLREVPGAGYWVATQLASRVRHLTDKCSELATLSVCARLHMEIIRLSAAAAGRDWDVYEIARFPTHTELAARIGSHREAVTRELRQLAKEGIVSQSRRERTLTIHSLSRLRALMARMAR